MGYFNFSGYNTADVLRYNIDDRDLHLLSYFYAIQGSDNMEFLNENFKIYYWVRFEKIIDDNPTLYVKKRTLDTMISNLCEKGLLEKLVKCQEGTTFKKTYFRITDKCREMMFSGTLHKVENVEKDIENFKEVGNEITINNNIKNKYGEFNNVSLTDDELEKLKEKFPYDWEKKIENLSSYLAQFNKKYKSHYATILNWSRKDSNVQSVQNVHNAQNEQQETQQKETSEVTEEERNAWLESLWK